MKTLLLLLLFLGCACATTRATAEDIAALNDETVQVFLSGDIAGAREAALRALAAARNQVDNPLGLAVALGNLGEIERRLDNAQGAAALFSESVGIYDLFSLTDGNLASVLNNWGMASTTLGHFDLAESLFRRSLEVRGEANPSDFAALSTTRNNIADNYWSQGKLDLALVEYQNVVAMKAAPTDQVIYALRKQGELLHNLARDVEAREVLARASALAESVGGFSLSDLGTIYWFLGRAQSNSGKYADAAASFQMSAKALREAGSDHDRFRLDAELELCSILRLLGRRNEAEALITSIAAVAARDFPSDLELKASIAAKKGAIASDRGDLVTGEAFQREALALWEEIEVPPASRVSAAMSSLGITLYWQGKNDEALPYLRRAVEIAFNAHLTDATFYALVIANLSNYFGASLSYQEAEEIVGRAIEIMEDAGEVDSASYGSLIAVRGHMYWRLGRGEESVALLERAVKILLDANARVEDLAVARNQLGNAYLSIGETEPAKQQYLQAIELWREDGTEPRELALSLSNLAQVEQASGDVNAAERLFDESVELFEKPAREFDVDLAHVHFQRGMFLVAHRRYFDAERDFRVAYEIAINRMERSWSYLGNDAQAQFDREIDGSNFYAAILNATYLPRPTLPQAKAQASQLLELAQWADIAKSGYSLGATYARWSISDTDAQELVRRRQDLAAEVASGERVLLRFRLGEAIEADGVTLLDLENEIESLKDQANTMDAELRLRAPDYMNLAFPRPLSVAEVQGYLMADEVLVYIQVTRALPGHPEETLIWIVDKDDVMLEVVEPGFELISRTVQTLRCGLDYQLWIANSDQCSNLTGSPWEDGGGPLPYRLDRAYQLYEIVLGRFESRLADKRIFLVSPGPLATIPFQALVTREPEQALPETWQGYRNVPWLVRNRVIASLPSVSTLRFLRGRQWDQQSDRGFAGFGNPALDGTKQCVPARPATSCDFADAFSSQQRPEPRSLASPAIDLSGAGVAERAAKVRSMCPVPETGHELACIDQRLVQTPTTLFTGEDFTEEQLRALSESGQLGKFAVITFATHGLLPDQALALEPALVATPSLGDDGLITATEISKLRLNAEWVLLAACNTASGTGGTDGLANAFFYAGATSVLISHWEADAEATAFAVARMVGEDDEAMPLSEALGVAEQMLADSTARPDFSHPSVWAVFTVIGDGLAANGPARVQRAPPQPHAE